MQHFTALGKGVLVLQEVGGTTTTSVLHWEMHWQHPLVSNMNHQKCFEQKSIDVPEFIYRSYDIDVQSISDYQALSHIIFYKYKPNIES